MKAPLLILAVLSVLLLGACSSSSGGAKQPNTEAGLKDAVRKSFEGFINNDFHATYDAYSKECRDKTSYKELAATLVVAQGFFEAFMDVKVSDLKVTEVQTRNVANGKGEARVRMASKKDASKKLDDDDDKFQPWVYEDGGWHETNCADMTIGGSDGGGTSTPSPSRTDASATSTRTPTRTPTPGPTSTPTPGPAVRVGQPYEVDGLRLTINEIRDPYTPTSSFEKPDAGNRIVAFDVTVEGVKAGSSYNPFYFALQDEQSFVYTDSSFGTPQPRLSSGEAGAGEKVRGWVALEVPANAKLTKLLWKRFGPSTTLIDLTKP